MCAIVPINSSPEFKTKFVSASNVMAYVICGVFLSLNVFSLKSSLLGFSIYSLNSVISPLFLSQPKNDLSFWFHFLFLYRKWNLGKSSS